MREGEEAGSQATYVSCFGPSVVPGNNDYVSGTTDHVLDFRLKCVDPNRRRRG